MKEENDIFKKITNKAKTLKLTEKERGTLFSRVDSYVKKNPISINKTKNIQNDIKWSSYIFGSYSRMVSFALVVFIVLGGSASAAAGNALPGNPLYPIKVNINEGIKSLFVSSANKVNFEAERAALRISEAETLAKKGTLSAKAKLQVEQYFDAHIAKVESGIQKYKDNGELKKAFETSNKLELSLKDREESLANLAGLTNEKSDEQLINIAKIVQVTIASSTLAREQVEQIIVDSDGDSDDVRVVAETRLSALKMLVGGLNDRASVSAVMMTASEDTNAKVQANPMTKEAASTASTTPHNPGQDVSIWLEESSALTAEGEEKMRQGHYKEAHNLFKRAYNVAEEAKILKQLHEIEDVKIDD